MAYDVTKVSRAAVEVKQSGGNMNTLVKRFCSADEKSEDFAKAKQNLTQLLTNTRKTLRERLMSRGMSEDEAKAKVATVCPTFRDGRSTSKKAAIDELFNSILGSMEDDSDDDDFDDSDE